MIEHSSEFSFSISIGVYKDSHKSSKVVLGVVVGHHTTISFSLSHSVICTIISL